MPRSLKALLIALAALALVAGCSSDDSADSGATSSTASNGSTTESTAVEAKTLTILVSNDDGYATDNIAALVDGLAALPNTEVIVSAPAENQSGQGSNVSDGELSAIEVTTNTGHPAFAVDGTPADSVNWALDGGIDVVPDLVVTGINEGQNLGAIGDQVSGTIGAARAAAARDIPALAVSATHSDQVDLDEAVAFVTDWVSEHRDGILDGEYTGDTLLLENLNIPLCDPGELRGVLRVEMSESSEGAYEQGAVDCEAAVEPPSDDITAFNNGWVPLSTVTLEARPAA